MTDAADPPGARPAAAGALLARRQAIDEAVRRRAHVRFDLDARRRTAVTAIAAVLVPRAERDVLDAIARRLGDPALSPDALLAIVEPRRRQLEASLGDVDVDAVAREIAATKAERQRVLLGSKEAFDRVALVERDHRYAALCAAAEGGADDDDGAAAVAGLLNAAAPTWGTLSAALLVGRVAQERRALVQALETSALLASRVARLERVLVRRHAAERGLRALDDQVLADARARVTTALDTAFAAARIDEPAVVDDLIADDIAACRGVVRAARALACLGHWLDDAWTVFVAAAERRLDAAALSRLAGLDGVGDVDDDVLATVDAGLERFDAVCDALLSFHGFEHARSADHLWAAVVDDDTRRALGSFHDGAWLPDVRRARARAALHMPTIVTAAPMTATTSPPPIHTAVSATAALSSTSPEIDVIVRLGRYRLEQRLGQGGMAEVFLATQDGPRGFARRVVVKRILAAHADDPHYIAMFQREAAVVARLQHPNVVDVYELGVEGDRWFIAMELLEGRALHELAGPSRPPIGALARIFADAAHGLAHAHAHGVVHRDISPDNLFVGRSGLTKVIDFGIARSDDDPTMTRVGTLKGKIPFMAPELFSGAAVEPAVDVFALGVSLWSLLVGHRPWDGDSLARIVRSILEVPALPPSRFVGGVPVDVDQLVLAMLARDPAARPRAADVAIRLDALAASALDVARLVGDAPGANAGA